MAIRQTPYGSNFQINQEYGTKDKIFSSHVDYADLLLSKGIKSRDWADLTEVARNFYSQFSDTLSDLTTPFIDKVMASGGARDIKHNQARWKVYGRPDRRPYSLGNPNGAVQYIGSSGNIFKVQFDRDYYQPGMILVAHENKSVEIMLQSYGTPVAGGAEYEAVLVQKDTFLPPEFLASGKYWLVSAPATSHMGSDTAGVVDLTLDYAYVEFAVNLHTSVWEMTVDEETALKSPTIMVSRCDVDDNIIESGFTNIMEVEFEFETRRQQELRLMYGRASDHHIDPFSQKQITTSPGYFQFMEESNIVKYNPRVNSIAKMVDLIKSYWYDKVPINQRHLVLMTGEAGLDLWHKWIEEEFGQTATVTDVNFILGRAQAFDSDKQGFSFGNYQFTEYKIQPFGKVTVGYWPILDNTRVNGAIMEGTNYTIDSFKFIAMDYGAGEPNIQLLTRNEKNMDQYYNGLWSPVGPTPQGQVDDRRLGWAYQKVKRRSYGLAVMDVSRTLMFVPTY